MDIIIIDVTHWEYVYIAIDNKYVKYLYPIQADSTTLTSIAGIGHMDWRVNITLVDWHSSSTLDLTLMGVFASSITNIWVREVRADFFGCFYTCLSCTVDNSANHCTSCIAGYFLSGSQCKPCDSSCAQCSTTASYCTACSGSTHLYQNQCVDTCSAGFYVDATNACSACGASCTSCISNTNCVICNDGFFSSAGACVACNPTCSKCTTSATNCLECSNTALFAQSGSCVATCSAAFYQSDRTCLGCPTGCATCSSATVCNSCSASYLSQGTSCKTTCDLGYYQSSASACSACDITCRSCSGTATSCSSCPDKFYLDDSTCKPCKGPCVNCLGEEDCLSCVDPLVELAKKCVTSCPDGKYALAGRCQNCESPCTTCKNSSRSCVTCKSGFAFLMSSCLKTCPSGYFIYNQKVCCPTECLSCDEKTGACIECAPGRYLNKTSHECLACSSECLECKESPSQCTKCGHKQYIFEKTCVAKCLENGYYVDNGSAQCRTCYSDCKTCTGGKQEDCNRCIDGFALYQSRCMVCGTKASPFDLVDGNCVDRCGDGRRFSPEIVPYLATYNVCDDGNNIDGDGCSSRCEVEQGYSCFFGNETSPDRCRENVSPTARISKVGDNKLLLRFSESIRNWSELEISNYVRLKSSKLILDTNYTYSISKTENANEALIDINFLNSVQSERIRVILNRNNITDVFGNRLRTSQLTATFTYKIYPRLGSEGFFNGTSIAFGVIAGISSMVSPLSGIYLCQSSSLMLSNMQRIGYHYLLNSVYQDDINYAMLSLFCIFNFGVGKSWPRNTTSTNKTASGLVIHGRRLEEFSNGVAQGGLYFANDFINSWMVQADAFFLSELSIAFLVVLALCLGSSMLFQSRLSRSSKPIVKWLLFISSNLMIGLATFLHFPATVKSMHNLMVINVSSLTEILIAFLSILTFLLCLALPVIILIATNKDTMILWHPHYYLRFGSLYALVKIDRPITRNFYSIIFAKNTLLGIFLIVCISSPMAQNLMMCFAIAGYCGLVLKYRPFINVYLAIMVLVSEGCELGLHVLTIINSFLIKRHHTVMLSITSHIMHAFYILFVLCNMIMFLYFFVLKLDKRVDFKQRIRDWHTKLVQKMSRNKVVPVKTESAKTPSNQSLRKSQTIPDSPKSEVSLNKFKSHSMNNVASVKDLAPLESEKLIFRLVTLEELDNVQEVKPNTSNQQPAVFSQFPSESDAGKGEVPVEKEETILNSEEEFLKARDALLNMPTNKASANNFADVERGDEEYFFGYRD
jgi:hypothetical protein